MDQKKKGEEEKVVVTGTALRKVPHLLNKKEWTPVAVFENVFLLEKVLHFE